MQDAYVGDIGDYGKYGLLRTVCDQGLSLSVNWYRLTPKAPGKQDDGKYTNYLLLPQKYRFYDPELFDALHKIVYAEKNRSIELIESNGFLNAKCFSETIGADRYFWHYKALQHTAKTDVVFLDPDNGLETEKMFIGNSAGEKHVKWTELSDYYARGQNVILYQHRPQMTKKEKCIESVMQFQKYYLKADCVMLLEFPKFTNRFYFMFVHEQYRNIFENICSAMLQNWGCGDFCREIDV